MLIGMVTWRKGDFVGKGGLGHEGEGMMIKREDLGLKMGRGVGFIEVD